MEKRRGPHAYVDPPNTAALRIPFFFLRGKNVSDEPKQTKMDGRDHPIGKILLSEDLHRGSTDADV